MKLKNISRQSFAVLLAAAITIPLIPCYGDEVIEESFAYEETAGENGVPYQYEEEGVSSCQFGESGDDLSGLYENAEDVSPQYVEAGDSSDLFQQDDGSAGGDADYAEDWNAEAVFSTSDEQVSENSVAAENAENADFGNSELVIGTEENLYNDTGIQDNSVTSDNASDAIAGYDDWPDDSKYDGGWQDDPPEEETSDEDSGSCGNNLRWKLEDDVLTITGTGDMWDWSSEDVTAPWSYKSAKKIIISDGVTGIGTEAFDYLDGVEEISIPESVTRIGSAALNYCWIKSIILPQKLRRIEDFVLNGCSLLTEVDLPHNLESIGRGAFARTGLIRITIPESVTDIGAGAFSDTPIKAVFFTGDAPNIGKKCFGADEVQVFYPVHNKTWTSNVKQNYGGLVTWIPWDPATGEKGTPEEEKLSKCGDNLYWKIKDGTVYISGTGDMWDWQEYGSSPWEYYSNITRVVVEPGVTSIGDRSFVFCQNMKSISLPTGLLSIGHEAFDYCTGLHKIELPDTLTTIKESAFSESSITDIKLPDSLNYIGSYAFRTLEITKIIIPENVKTIGKGVFSSSINEVYFKGDFPSLDKHSFSSITATVYYPAGNATWTDYNKQTYGGTITWMAWDPITGKTGEPEKAGIHEVYEFGNGLRAVLENDTLTVSSNGNYVDWDSGDQSPWSEFKKYIKRIIVEEGIGNIGDVVFSGCTALTSVKLPDSIKWIGESSFRGCTSLKSIDLPKNLKSLSWDAFNGCTNLTNVELPEGMKDISDWAFENCTSLNKITIPATVISIGESAFGCCGKLNIYFKGDAPFLGKGCFTDVDTMAFYPNNNRSWTSEVRQQYGGKVTWVPWDPATGQIMYEKPKVSLNATNKTLYTAGNMKNFNLKPKASTGTIVSVSYSSSAPKVAYVDASTGKVSAKGTGKATVAAKVTVKYPGGKVVIDRKCQITVKKPTLKVSPGSIAIRKGKTKKLSVKAVPGGKISYKSSDKSIATVSTSGKITAKKKGKCRIVVTCNGVAKTVKVTVN